MNQPVISKPTLPERPAPDGAPLPYPYLFAVGLPSIDIENMCIREGEVVGISTLNSVMVDVGGTVYENVPVYLHTDRDTRLRLLKGDVQDDPALYFTHSALHFPLGEMAGFGIVKPLVEVAMHTDPITFQATPVGVVNILQNMTVPKFSPEEDERALRSPWPTYDMYIMFEVNMGPVGMLEDPHYYIYDVINDCEMTCPTYSGTSQPPTLPLFSTDDYALDSAKYFSVTERFSNSIVLDPNPLTVSCTFFGDDENGCYSESGTYNFPGYTANVVNVSDPSQDNYLDYMMEFQCAGGVYDMNHYTTATTWNNVPSPGLVTAETHEGEEYDVDMPIISDYLPTIFALKGTVFSVGSPIAYESTPNILSGSCRQLISNAGDEVVIDRTYRKSCTGGGSADRGKRFITTDMSGSFEWASSDDDLSYHWGLSFDTRFVDPSYNSISDIETITSYTRQSYVNNITDIGNVDQTDVSAYCYFSMYYFDSPKNFILSCTSDASVNFKNETTRVQHIEYDFSVSSDPYVLEDDTDSSLTLMPDYLATRFDEHALVQENRFHAFVKSKVAALATVDNFFYARILVTKFVFTPYDLRVGMLA